MNDFADFLTRQLKSPLPGWSSQSSMSPFSSNGFVDRNLPVTPKKSAVLILFYPDSSNNIRLVYTLRTSFLKKHSGQISFPGGRADGNETPIQTALRETHEEIGINPNDIQIVGNLSKLDVYHSNSRVQPVVGFMEFEPTFKKNPSEVAEIISYPLSHLLDASSKKFTTMTLGSEIYTVPYYHIHKTPLWGATAMITAEILELLKEWNGEV